MSCVYKFTFPNGSVYIGETSMEPEDRWLDGWGYKAIPQVFASILKYGWDNVKKEILYDNLSDASAKRLELKTINEYSEMLLAQSELHIEDSSTEDDAQSELHSEAPCTFLLNEVGISQAYLNVQMDGYIEPGKSRVSGRKAKNRPNKKKNTSRISIAHIPIVEKPVGMKNCPVSVYDLDGNYIVTYPSVKVAAEELHVSAGDVVSCCRGYRSDGVAKRRVREYIFRYAPNAF